MLKLFFSFFFHPLKMFFTRFVAEKIKNFKNRKKKDYFYFRKKYFSSASSFVPSAVASPRARSPSEGRFDAEFIIKKRAHMRRLKDDRFHIQRDDKTQNSLPRSSQPPINDGIARPGSNGSALTCK